MITKLIKQAAKYMHQAYTHELETLGPVQFRIVPFNNGDVQGRAVVFQGTSSIEDVKSSLSFWRRTWYADGGIEGYRVMSGFAEQGEYVAERMQAEMTDEDQPPIVAFIGHSLGGALAMLFSVRYAVPCYTFGSPRIGNRAFCRALEPLHARITVRGDLVPHLPPIIFGYRHAAWHNEHLGPKPRWWQRLAIWDTRRHWPYYYLQQVNKL